MPRIVLVERGRFLEPGLAGLERDDSGSAEKNRR